MKHRPEADPAPALGRGLMLLRRLQADGAMSLERLAGATGWPKSSVLRLLRSLELAGAVVREPVSRRYRALVHLVPVASSWDQMLDAAAGIADPLAEAVGQTVELFAPQGRGLVMIGRWEPESAAVSVRARVGFVRDLTEFDAPTQIALAFGAKAIRSRAKALWAWRNGKETPVTDGRVQSILQTVYDERIANDLDVNINGVRRSAAPILAADGQLLAIISVAQVGNPSSQMLAERGEQLLTAANRIGGASLFTTKTSKSA